MVCRLPPLSGFGPVTTREGAPLLGVSAVLPEKLLGKVHVFGCDFEVLDI